MAYSTGSYTSIDNAGDLVYAWALTNGWTQNYSAADGTGKRYHIEKSIGGTDFFFNFRTAVAETVAGAVLTSGITLQGSTAWDGSGTAWDAQTGFTTSEYQGSVSRAGTVDRLKAGGGTYHFFATATNLTAVFETESDEGDWRILTAGAVGGFPSYFASGGLRSNDADRSSYVTPFFISPNTRNGNSALFIPTEGWYVSQPSLGGSSNTRIVGDLVSRSVDIDDIAVSGSITNSVVHASPDSFRGNAQLAPSSVNITKGDTDEYWPMGDIEGVKFINMTNYTNGQEITDTGDVYKLFRIHNPYPLGVAFLK